MLWPVDGMAAFPEYSQRSTGGPSFPRIALINEALTITQPNSALRLGQYVIDGDGNMFQYVQAKAALAQGNSVKQQLGTVSGTVQTADATGDGIHRIKTNITGITNKNQEVGNYLHFAVAGFTPVIARIKGNTATSGGVTYFDISIKDVTFGRGGYDADAYAAGIANAVAVQIYRPYAVIPTAAVAETGACGFAMGTVTSGNATLIQVQGQTIALTDGSTDALVVNKVVVPSGTAGTVKGQHAAAAGDAVEAASGMGYALYASSGAATLAPIMATCFGKM